MREAAAEPNPVVPSAATDLLTLVTENEARGASSRPTGPVTPDGRSFAALGTTMLRRPYTDRISL